MGFCHDIFFPVRAFRRSIWVSVQAYILLVRLQVGKTGDLSLLVVQSSPCSPTKAPLRSPLQQNVQQSFTQQRSRTYWALTPSDAQASTVTVATPLITNQYRPAVHGCHTWRSCNKFGITDTFYFRAGGTRWSTYLNYRCHAHIQGFWSTAVLLQHSMSDLLSAVAHSPVGASTVDGTVPQPQRSCS